MRTYYSSTELSQNIVLTVKFMCYTVWHIVVLRLVCSNTMLTSFGCVTHGINMS